MKIPFWTKENMVIVCAIMLTGGAAVLVGQDVSPQKNPAASGTAPAVPEAEGLGRTTQEKEKSTTSHRSLEEKVSKESSAEEKLKLKLQTKYSETSSIIELLWDFPVLAKLLACDDPWILPPEALKELLFSDENSIKLAQGSQSYPLSYVGLRTSDRESLDFRVWELGASEIDYTVADPSRPAITFHIGMPSHTFLLRNAMKKTDCPDIAATSLTHLHQKIQTLVQGLKPFGARYIPVTPKISQYVLPGGLLLEYADYTGSYNNPSPYVRITLRPENPISSMRRLPAFPGAEGAGMYSIGGRGGKVYVVTTLADYLPQGRRSTIATLGQASSEVRVRALQERLGEDKVRWIPNREGLPDRIYPLPKPEEEYGPIIPGSVRVIIPAQESIPSEPVIPGSLREAVEAKGPRIIVFAVSGTIELKAPLSIDNPYLTLAGQTAPGQGIQIRNWWISTNRLAHDIVIRYMRVRVGDIKGPGNAPRLVGDQTRACDLFGMNIILDHCEFAYANDQIFNVPSGIKQSGITLQWSYVYGGLKYSTHDKGIHSMSYGLGGWGEVSMHHNLTAFSDARNPRCWGLNLDWRNNILYTKGAGYGSTQMTLGLNYVGNTQFFGANAFETDSPYVWMYAKDNNLLSGDNTQPFIASKEVVLKTPFPSAPVSTDPADVAYLKVLSHGGADLPARDEITQWVAESVRTKTGEVPGTTDDWPKGGYATYPPADTIPDTDRDGMSDAWEKQHGLNPEDASDSSLDPDGDGYTNIEEFLNDTNPREFIDYYIPSNNIHSLHRTDSIHLHQ